jgi:hypothetical protein
VNVWWIRLPLAVRRVSAGIADALLDGYYLVAWPLPAMIAPPTVFVLSLLIGALHPGFDLVYSESLAILLLATVLGVLSAHLGLLFVLGYALGDFFIWHSRWVCSSDGGWLARLCWEQVLRSRLPLLIAYGVLALVTVGIPIATKGLLAQFPPPRSVNRTFWFSFLMVAHAALTGVLVFFWAQAVPLLIRPVFTWSGSSPPIEAMSPLQQQVAPLILAVVVASLVRMALQGATAALPRPAARISAWEARLRLAIAVGPAASKSVPPAVHAVTAAAWSTLLLAGLFEGWLDAIVIAALLLVLQAARMRLIPVPLGRWPEIVNRLPLLARMAAGIVISLYLARTFLSGQLRGGESFRPLLLVLSIGLIITFLFNPGPPAAIHAGRKQPR